MKNILLIFFFVYCASILNAQGIINFFEVTDNIAKPVTLNTNEGEITIWGGEHISGNIRIYSAYDANGNKIVTTTLHITKIGTDKPTICHYYFQTLYNSSFCNNSSSSMSSNNEMEISIERTTESVEQVQTNLIKLHHEQESR